MSEKNVKTKAYSKRYQVKYRRRREGKTDYYARKKLIKQDKDKYNTAKYRVVVRFTNKDIICQVITTKVNGDFVLESAYSHELEKYGIKVGLTNYPAAYCVGLLCARRVLTKLGLDKDFVGQEDVNGEYYLEEENETHRPFKAFLDTGLARTSTGAKIFGVLKGMVDGGVYVPHSESRFPGYDKEADELDTETFRKHIFGGHISDYMAKLKEENPEKYKKQFNEFIKKGVEAESLEPMYRKAHEMIRNDPNRPSISKEEKEARKRIYSENSKKHIQRKLTLAERKEKIYQRLSEALACE